GSFYRIPLWELVYHDCTVAQWYWGDASNKAPEVWDQRDLINILYATPPMFAFDQAQWTTCKDRFVQSYKNVCPIARKLGYDEMLSHVFLNAEHTVQQTRWKSGAEITVNFGDTPYTLPDGRIIAAKGWGTRGM
ncbi:MAG TPA: glycoside hydrolase, partial [Armatimonadota bacterium]|nr:glycoside hydrolase [Armatimonadota bacterium]